jgi:hypothetical protein
MRRIPIISIQVFEGVIMTVIAIADSIWIQHWHYHENEGL